MSKPKVKIWRDDHGIVNLKAQGKAGGIKWNVYASGDRPMESGSITLWAGNGQMSVNAEYGWEDLQGELPTKLTKATKIDPKTPDEFFELLVSLGLPATELNELWPTGATGAEGSRRVRQYLRAQ